MSDKKTSIPEKNSSQWRKNESIIARNPVLREARDISEGFTPGKATGSRTPVPSQQYKDNYDAIFGKRSRDSEE